MVRKTLEDIIYIFKKAKEKNKPNPIVFIGAGASASSGIPLANKIRIDVLKIFRDKPSIQRLSKKCKLDYYEVMGALSPDERRNLFYNYISAESVKINVTHIYLAQLINEGYVDYVLTPNFDDLLLRACALFNFIPPVYDASILNDFTTTTFRSKSVTYLHGQYHGQWLLNAMGELEKVKSSVPKIFERICNNRAWIIVGYGGQDGLLDEIAKLGSFDNELYWIGYENKDPAENVKHKLLDKPAFNTYLVDGNTSDSFFLKLHAGLGLRTPDIFNKSFTFLQTLLKGVKDMEELKSDFDLFRNVAERLDMTKKWVRSAIERFENTSSIELLKQNIIEDQIKNNYSNLDEYLDIAIKTEDQSLKKEVASLLNSSTSKKYNEMPEKERTEDFLNDCLDDYKRVMFLNSSLSNPQYNAGLLTMDLAQLKQSSELYDKALKFFETSIKYNPQNSQAYKKWGDVLFALAKFSGNSLLTESFKKYKRATEINPEAYLIFFNWATGLRTLASINYDASLYKQAILKYKKVLKLRPKHEGALYGLARALKDLGFLRLNSKTLEEAIGIYKKCKEIKPSDLDYIYGLGSSFVLLGHIKENGSLIRTGIKYFDEAALTEPKEYKINAELGWAYYNLGLVTKNLSGLNKSIFFLKKSVHLNPKNPNVYTTWCSAEMMRIRIIKPKSEKPLLIKAYKLAKKAYELGGRVYNLACISALLDYRSDALKYLNESLEKKEITKNKVLKDTDWTLFLADGEFKRILSTFKLIEYGSENNFEYLTNVELKK